MNCKLITAFYCFFLCGNLLAIDSHNQGSKSDKNSASKKELVKTTSKSSAFFTKVKKDKKVSIDEGERAIITYQDLVVMVKSNDLNKLKTHVTENNELVLLANEKGENVVYFIAANNKVGALEAVLGAVEPDVGLEAINHRSLAKMSALHIAVQQGAHDAVVMMLSKGAAVDLPGPAHITAYIMALNKRDKVMACILAAFGARVIMTPIDDDQSMFKAVKLLSSECKEFFLSTCPNGEHKIDKNFMGLFADYLHILTEAIVAEHQEATLSKNLKEYQNSDISDKSSSLVEEVICEASKITF